MCPVIAIKADVAGEQGHWCSYPVVHQTDNKARPDIFKLKQCSACAQVDLYENGTIAIVEAVSPELGNRVQRVRVQLPGTSQELLQRFREKSVDFAAHSNTEDGGAVFLNLLGEPAWVGCVQACLSALFQCAAYTLSTSYLLFTYFLSWCACSGLLRTC